jgi:hypothetical protein
VANYRDSTNTNNRNKNTQTNKQKTKKIIQLSLFIFKSEFMKIYVDLQTASVAETQRAEGQWLEEQQTRENYVCSE